MIDILINQVDEHNESNILATQEFNPSVVYFIKDKDSEEKMKTLRLYYEKNFEKIKIEEFLVEEGDKEFQAYADKALSYVMAALGTHLK